MADTLTCLDIVRNPIPHWHLLDQLLHNGCQIAGGFPLWLAGGSMDYSDIDVYVNTWELFFRMHSCLAWEGVDLGPSMGQKTAAFEVEGTVIQLVKPGYKHFDDMQLAQSSDLSPSACILNKFDGDFTVWALYPDDIKNKVCRVLHQHEWTWYRTRAYREKGYTILEENGYAKSNG